MAAELGDLASVDPLPGKEWSAKGAAGDALRRVGHGDAFIAIWRDEKNELQYVKANTDGTSMSIFACLLMEMAQRCFRNWLNGG